MKKFLFLVFLMMFSTSAYANTITVPTTWITGDTVTAVKLNNINSTFANVINGGLDNNNADTADGYFFFKRVATLPAAGTQGAVYFLTSDNTLNLDTGSVFITASTIGGTHAQGDIIYYNGSSFLGLAAGTSGYVLATQGAGANPVWQAVSTTAGNAVIPLENASGYMPANSVDTNALKTAVGSVSTASANASLTLPGGSYGFFPQLKGSGSAETQVALRGASGTTNPVDTNYTTYLSIGSIAGGATIFAQQRYVTSSGTDFWLFILLDKSTNDVVSVYAAADHPAYGNGGDFDKLPQPFGKYDVDKYDVVLIDNDSIAELKAQVTPDKQIIDLVNSDYKVLGQDEAYVPLHSGKFIDENGNPVKQMVKSVPDYVHVRKLAKLTSEEKADKESRIQKAVQDYAADKASVKQAKISALDKLKSIGMTDKEVESLKQ